MATAGRGLLALPGLLLLACTLAAPTPLPTDQPFQAAPVAGPATVPAPTATVRPEATLRLPLTEPPTLDPGLAEDSAPVEVISQLFEGLVAFDQSGDPSPLGAESWTISPDGLSYTFTLRDGPRWSDGKPVTAQDYAWAWRRNVSPVTASPHVEALYPLKNARQISEGRLGPEQLGVVATDDRTLMVSLEQPAAYFLRLASSWTLAPLRQDVIERFGNQWTEPQNLVTNGPFKLAAWQHDSQLILERNDQYWGPKPALNKVNYRIFPVGGTEQVLAAYRADQLETTGNGTVFELSPEQVDRVQADPRLQTDLGLLDQSATMFIAVNDRRPHLRDARVRIALGLALDRAQLIMQVAQRVAKPAYSLQPEGIAGRDPAAWATEDAAAARKLLAEAGYPDGNGLPEITFTYTNGTLWRQLGEYLQRRWRETLGVRLRLEAMEWGAFLKWRRSEAWVQRGDLFRGGWFSDYEDPHDWYNALWDSESDPLAFNSGWKDDQYDALVRAAAGERDRSGRESLYHQAEGILAREYPAIPVFHFATAALVKPYVEGFLPERVLGVVLLKNVRLAD